MKKALRNVLLGAVCCSMALTMAGCGKDEGSGDKKYDTETRPLTLAIGACDENFNPFFYTALNDGEIVGLTQISMLAADKDGNVACGQNEPTAVLDYKVTMLDAAGNETATGDMNGSTVYEFVIKNGIKFSDGVDLTIRDVMFNLYVYLDPLYFGSNTIYSTKIKGLAQYRAQNMSVGDDYDYTSQFSGQADARVSAVKEYAGDSAVPITDQISKDIKTASTLFKTELGESYTNAEGTIKSYEENYNFTEDWEIFLFETNIVSYQTTPTGVRKKGANGKYLTSLDADDSGTVASQSIINAMNDALSDDKINAYMSAHGADRDVARSALMREAAIDIAYSVYFDENGNPTTRERLGTVINQMIASEFHTEILNEIMSDYYKNLTESGSGLNVKSISGITSYKTSSFDGEKGEDLDGEHDVLRIEISGVDPAAIWQFGFTVAPMHYYSTPELTAFSRDNFNDVNASNRFGVRFMDKDFFNNVLNAQEKTANPVGAGSYKARDNFYTNRVASYERNEYFETLGTGISNAKIKYVNYKYTPDNGIIDALKSDTVDYGEPNCTPDNIRELTGVSKLSNRSYDTNGFGYIGINAKAVPDIEVRQAIFKGLDVSLPLAYYSTDYAKYIYRPMSLTSWIYSEAENLSASKRASLKSYPASLEQTSDVREIQRLLTAAGYHEGNNTNDSNVKIWEKDGKLLEYTFTIAGETQDHPAFRMFQEAKTFLQRCGFKITVTTDPQALIKLATGSLEVWSAAWTSGIDPDMYQVYHKDSKASSVRNWGYPEILENNNHVYDEELAILNNLSNKIMEARQTINRTTRTDRYIDALNLVMDLAVELPIYQRNDLAVYNTDILNSDTLNIGSGLSANTTVLHRIWEVDYN